jgi:2-polyprenyl-3-methyl-5-hydroxy-6-metoxy-1,4-benzoquinol methylase
MHLTVKDLEDRAFLARLSGMTRLELDFIARHRRRFEASLDIVHRMINYDSVLDVGCGRGVFLLLLGETGIGVGQEEEVDVCRGRGIQAYACDLEGGALPFPDKSFELILCLEVLEHVRNRNGLMREIYRILRVPGELLVSTPNSKFASWKFRDLVMSVPFGSKLYYRDLKKSRVQKDVYHYSVTELRDFLARNGFRVKWTGYARILLPKDDIIMLAVKGK